MSGGYVVELLVIRVGEMSGALGGTRTHGLILRRDALYPSELQARISETDNFEVWAASVRPIVLLAGAEGGTRTHTPFSGTTS